MVDNNDKSPSLDHLTLELSIEVRRNLKVWLTFSVAVVALVSGLMALAVDPELSGVTGGVAVTLFALFLGILLPFVGMLSTLVYLFDCWPAVIRGRVLRERYGVAPVDLSGPAWRQSMGSAGFWAAGARGAIVGWGFASALILTWWGLTGKWGFIVPSVMLVLLGGQFSAWSWFLRRAVAGVRIPVAVHPMPESIVAPMSNDIA